MQQGSGILLILGGLLLLWIIISGKFDLAEAFFLQLFDLPLPNGTGTASASGDTLPGTIGINAGRLRLPTTGIQTGKTQ